MNLKTASSNLNLAAADYIPDDVDLLPQIAARYQEKSLRKTLVTRPVLAVFVVLLGIIVLTGAAYAVGRLTGYIPGFGFVSEGEHILVLDEPVVAIDEGVNVNMTNAVSDKDVIVNVVNTVNDENQFWVELTVNQGMQPESRFDARIMLPDGQEMNSIKSSWSDPGSGESYGFYTFHPLPVDTESVILLFEYDYPSQDVRGTIEIPLSLRPAKPEDSIPVQETTIESLQNETYDGVTLVLDSVATSDDQTVMQVSLQFDHSSAMSNCNWGISLTDENNKVYPVTSITPEMSYDTTKVFSTVPFSGGEKLILKLEFFPDSRTLPVMVDFSNNSGVFRFDPGTDPQAGQHWSLDETIQVGEFEIQLTGATLKSSGSLVFEFAPHEKVTGVMLSSVKASGFISQPNFQNGAFTTELTFYKLPSEPFDVQITGVNYNAHGDWEIKFQAPPAPED